MNNVTSNMIKTSPDKIDLCRPRGRCFKQKTNSSQRTILAMEHVDKVVEAVSLKQKKKLCRNKRFSFRKNKNMYVEHKLYPFKALKCVLPNKVSARISPVDLKRNKYFFVYDPLKQIPNDYFKGVCNKKIIKDITHFQLIDEINGCYGFSNNNIPPFILVPRKQSLSCGTMDIISQEESLLKLVHGVTETKRGESKNAIYSYYATVGVHVKRGSPGLSYKKIKETLQEDFTEVIKMVQKAEHCAASVLPSAMIEGVKRTKELFNWPTFVTNSYVEEKKESVLWASVATSYNYTSAAHVDSDFLLSMVTVTTSEHMVDNKYMINQPIALYFVFPELGIAIGLRPGDQLIFNPLYYHCISSKNFGLYKEPVHVTSFYLKTGIVGGNNNRQTLDSKLYSAKV